MAPAVTAVVLLAFLALSSWCEITRPRDLASWPAHRREIHQRILKIKGSRLKRAEQTPSSCAEAPSARHKLSQNTHKHTFEDDDGSTVTLAWVGDGTGTRAGRPAFTAVRPIVRIVLALTTFNLPFSFIFFTGTSRLYRSEDFGKTFTDVSKVLNNYYIRKEFGINVGPENSKKVILTADVSKLKTGGAIFRSSDSGKTFEFIQLPFHPSKAMNFHPSNPSQLLAYCIKHSLWLSTDFGTTWEKLQDSVYIFSWGLENTIFYSYNPKGIYDVSARGSLYLHRTTDLGKSNTKLHSNIYSFGFAGRFLFSSVIHNQSLPRSILVSIDQGNTWNEAQLPPVGHKQFYSILGADHEMIFMHVDEPGNTGFGTIYTSDDRGILYSKSLERHLFIDSSGSTDFTNVTSLRGVYITNVLDKNNSIRSVITFDSGGEWTALQRPANSQCDKTTKIFEQCNLHIHAAYSISQKVDVPVLPLTAPNAVGVVIAHGSVGDVISTLPPDVYVSDDGGYTWWKALNGPHFYTMLDSGGLIVALESHRDRAVQIIKYSTDEGQCWHSYNFTNETFMFVGLVSEPGAKSMNVSLWGYKQESFYKTTWLSYTIDFNELLTRDCDEQDYVRWLAHSTNFGSITDGCVLGCKERYQRLAKSSVCRNGRDYQLTKEQAFCQCTKSDYMCDFGYYRVGNSEECIEQPDLKDKVLEFCLKGKEELLNTQGYRKIPGDRCKGGFMPTRSESVTNINCEEYLAVKGTIPKTSMVIVVLCVLAVSILMIGGAVIICKKYVCGGRSLVYRYSVLQSSNDEVCIADDLDSRRSNTERVYHDDSDVDLLD